ncbi:MAG: class I SAM-dependent methyltransferase [Leptolyngbyaceae bacterium]|nr:class I SAM-dependent methyltransferase [Leptolyngbyaceae bacterium]
MAAASRDSISTDGLSVLQDYLAGDRSLTVIDGIPGVDIPNPSVGLQANAAYFDRPESAQGYFESCHRDEAFRDRWLAAGGSWDGKIVVDVGCGPGNVYANLGGSPALLIGVDVSRGSLKMAQTIGYTPLLADAQDLPLRSEFADIVVVNATLHHCDDMVKALQESARLVRPGGRLIIDHDPQLSAWNYKGLAMLVYKIRLRVYQLLLPNLHTQREERLNALQTEIHHRPGDGVTTEMLRDTLNPMGFEVKIYPHNQRVGQEALQGVMGDPPHWRYQLGQRLSGLDPNSPEAALSLLCVAEKQEKGTA